MTDLKSTKLDWKLWRELCFDIGGLEMTGSDDGSFVGELRCAANGDLKIFTSICSYNVGQLTQKLSSARTEDNITVQLIECGAAILEMEDCQVVAEPGDLIIRDWSRPHAIASQPGAKQCKSAKVLTLPRAAMSASLNVANEASHFVLKHNLPGSRVASSFLAEIAQNLPTFTPEEARSYFHTLQDLVGNAMYFSQTRNDGVKSGALMRVQDEIMQRIEDPNLRLNDVAKAVGMSPRAVQRLFQEIGTTPQKWIEQRRLKLIVKFMTSSLNKKCSVTEVAYSYGFNDFSTFYRAFRRNYEMSPTQFFATKAVSGPSGAG